MKSVARKLEEKGLIANAMWFELYARLSGKRNQLRVGEYALPLNATPKEILATLTSGKSVQYAITISEGLNIFEISALLERRGVAKRDEFLRLARDPVVAQRLLGTSLPSLEGYLFPETYYVTKYTTAREMLEIMVARFLENYEALEKDPSWNSSRLTRQELVTLASIIEKETGAPEERPVISSVFHNRLRKKMRLQTDPTVIYGIWERDGTWDRNITREDLRTPSRYNTYILSGLPFGPIANPGLEALRSAGAPAKSEFLFFVSRNDGTHVFSKNYLEHQEAVTRFQLNREARRGKSWRDLRKRGAKP